MRGLLLIAVCAGLHSTAAPQHSSTVPASVACAVLAQDDLAINDSYFDYAVPVLTQARLPNAAMTMLSAGDGSETAFLRIRAGTFETGTVAEPLNLHGWQLVDEMNRLLAGERVTGYVLPVHLVTSGNVDSDGGKRLLNDPDNGYRDIYRRIWQRP
jgi:ribose transport system substrate-binding protein